MGAGSGVGADSVGVDSVEVASDGDCSVGLGSVSVGSVGIDSVDAGGDVGVKVGGGWDVSVGKIACPVSVDTGVTVRPSSAKRFWLSRRSRNIRMIVRMTATINLKRS